MTNFHSKRIRYISVSEMNKHLKYVFKYRNIHYREKLDCEPFELNAYIEDCLVYFYLTYKKGTKACTYVTRKDGIRDGQHIKGLEAFRIVSKYYKVPKVDEKYCGSAMEGGLSASPFAWFNPKFNNTRQRAYGYDLNSAYSAAMIQPIPDCSKPMSSGFIIPGKEIGFTEYLNEETGFTYLVARFEGYSLYKYPLMESPFKKFVEKWYGIKQNAKTKAEREKAKNVLNFSIGYFQRVNPFIRATIITRCNEYIKSLIDEETTLFANTDAIVSTKKLDLKLGNGLGEWKLEHDGYVAYRDYSYQWSDGKLSYKGIPKSWFPKDYDILRDNIPHNGNIYALYKDQLKRVEDIIKNENIQSSSPEEVL